MNESKYTSWPKGPAGSKVPRLLTTKVMAMPSATGRSMPIRRARASRQAPARKGWHENSSTGSDSTHWAQRSRWMRSGSISPGAVKYDGAAYIITCIMHRPATPRRHSMRRVSAWRCTAACRSCTGTAR